MARTYEADIKVLGGLPVTVEYTVARAEPDVGIMSDYVDEWWITHINDRKVKSEPKWLTSKLDEDKIACQIADEQGL